MFERYGSAVARTALSQAMSVELAVDHFISSTFLVSFQVCGTGNRRIRKFGTTVASLWKRTSIFPPSYHFALRPLLSRNRHVNIVCHSQRLLVLRQEDARCHSYSRVKTRPIRKYPFD